MRKAHDQLADLAKNVDDARVQSVSDLDKTWTDVRNAVADRAHRWIPVEKDIFDVIAAEPDYHFKQARESVLRKDYKAAGREIRRVVASFELESHRASVKGQKELDKTIANLEKLAKGLETGTTIAVTKLDKIIKKSESAFKNYGS